MIKVIETIINTPKVLTGNDSPITFDGISTISRCTPCCNGGWLSYQNGSPLFKIRDTGYTGRYEINFSATVSSATARSCSSADFMKTGVLIPDTIRSVTIAAPDDTDTVAFQKILRVCPYLSTSLSVQSVPSIVTPTDPTTPIETEPPIIVYGTFNIQRNNN